MLNADDTAVLCTLCQREDGKWIAAIEGMPIEGIGETPEQAKDSLKHMISLIAEA